MVLPSACSFISSWVYGDKNPFSIDISREKTVDMLKEAIVAKKFRSIDAYSLDLWLKIISTEDINKLQPSDLQDEDVLDPTLEKFIFITKS